MDALLVVRDFLLKNATELCLNPYFNGCFTGRYGKDAASVQASEVSILILMDALLVERLMGEPINDRKSQSLF